MFGNSWLVSLLDVMDSVCMLREENDMEFFIVGILSVFIFNYVNKLVIL